MELLAAVIMFVVVPSVFAEDFAWKSVPDWSLPPGAYVYKGVPIPESNVTKHPNSEVKTQSTQEQPKNAVASTEQSRTDPTNTQPQTSGQEKEEEVRIDREANEIAKKENTLSDEGNAIQRHLVAIGLITIFTQIALTLVQLYFMRTANEHAAAAALAAKESVEVADRGLKVSERVYIAVENWQMINNRRGEPLLLTCVLLNTGRTPATLGEYDMHTKILKELPPLPDYQHLPRKESGLL